MDRTERMALVGAGLLVVVFFAALVYAGLRLRIAVPTCVTNVAPFTRGEVIDKGDRHYEVHMVAKMWSFDPPEVRLPPGSDVELYLSSLDVTHGLYIEHTNVNLMAVPGAVNAARVRFDREGEYPVICHEYCGSGHQLMMGKFIIAAGALPAVPVHPEGGSASIGERLFEDNGCPACHSTDGSEGLGPTLQGVFGRRVKLADGSTVTADEEYLEEALREPNEQVVEGYQPMMPETPLTADDVHALVAYMKTL
jgi:cytochrome c oxidase subunit 2